MAHLETVKGALDAHNSKTGPQDEPTCTALSLRLIGAACGQSHDRFVLLCTC
jgi:hypothetical protein